MFIFKRFTALILVFSMGIACKVDANVCSNVRDKISNNSGKIAISSGILGVGSEVVRRFIVKRKIDSLKKEKADLGKRLIAGLFTEEGLKEVNLRINRINWWLKILPKINVGLITFEILSGVCAVGGGCLWLKNKIYGLSNLKSEEDFLTKFPNNVNEKGKVSGSFTLEDLFPEDEK